MARADKLIEGFKLGSLGVSRKPKVTIDSKGSGEIIRQGFNTVFKKDDAPFVYWKDSSDDWTYFLLIEAHDMKYKSFFIQIYGGSNLTPFYSENSGWTITRNGADWGAEVDFSSGYKEQVSNFDSLVSSIESGGVESLISRNIISKMRPFGGSRVAFDQWLESKGATLE
jgi:hypothetical protein